MLVIDLNKLFIIRFINCFILFIVFISVKVYFKKKNLKRKKFLNKIFIINLKKVMLIILFWGSFFFG